MPLTLEEFGVAVEASPSGSPGPTADWLDGHAAGLAEGVSRGRAEAEATSSHLAAELAQSLQDMAFAYAEAREQVLRSLGPLFGLVIDRLLPATAAESLAPWIAEIIDGAARSDSAVPLRIELHPDRIAAVAACLPPGFPATLAADPTLSPLAARLRGPEGESDLDIDACLAALREALASLLHPPADGALRHG